MSDLEDPQATTPSDTEPSADAPATGTSDRTDDGVWDDDDETVGGIPQEKAVRIAQIGLVVVALIVVAVILFAKSGDDDKSTDASTNKEGSTSASTTEPKAKKPAWPVAFNGRPPALGKTGQAASEVDPKAKPGVYVWNDFDGMHLWVVKGEGVPAITGTIDSNDEMQKADPAVEGAGTVTKDGKRATFEFPGTAPIEGVDFNPGFYGNKVVIVLNGPDGPIDAALVKTGSKSAPGVFPIVIEKTAPK